MQTRKMGDFEVSAMGLGCMNLSHAYGTPPSAEQGERVLLAALDAGVTLFDTAALYGFGANEALVGKVLSRHRSRFTLASKGGMAGVQFDDGVKRVIDGRPETIRKNCEDSLQRLQTDVIDLYYLHRWDKKVPIEDSVGAMADLVHAGKVRSIGLSNETPWGLSEFLRQAELHGLPKVVSVQNPYALVNRIVDNGLDETMLRSGVSLLAYSPLGFGALTGKYDGPGLDAAQPALGRLARFDGMRKQRWGRPETLAAARRYNALARDHGLTPTQLALAFCYTSWRVASTIIGVTTLAQLDDNLAAWGTTLSPELLAAVDAIRWELRDPAQ